ncbi:unnamed protein product [Urochloa decumbens]|uniref:C2H2-type domain-containing protein n=1 Tax=Urochloa decumbens TaxID=240449 RepID=A0ABC8VKC0_9POAL
MDGATGNEVFECEYCQRKFRSRRSRGGHLKAHRHLRASRQAAASAQNPPHQQQPNTSQQQLSVAVSLLALPAPDDTNSELVTVPLENAQDYSTPVVLFRCCCGAIEKIPQIRDELMERGTYEGGCFTLDCRHQHRRSEEIQPLTLLPPPAENTTKETSLDADVENEENIDLTLRI